jgi:hypothetical protein
MFRSIAYMSEMASEFSEADIEELIFDSRKRNKAVGVTGMLFCFSNRFLQVLEGPGSAVGALVGRIRLDPRHQHLAIVQDVAVETRAYADWPMRRLQAEELGEAERGFIFRALSAFEPRTLLGPKTRPIQGKLTAYLEQIMARAIPTRLPFEESEAISNLLYATEVLLLRNAEVNETLLERVAQEAQVSPRTALCFFPTTTALLRTCVLRILALEHQAFLSRLTSAPFEDETALAECITDFAIHKLDLASASEAFAEQFSLYGGGFTTETAQVIAAAVQRASPREGWPLPDLSPTRLAMSIAATDAAACIEGRYDKAISTDETLRPRLLDICLAALVGRREAPRQCQPAPKIEPGSASNVDYHSFPMRSENRPLQTSPEKTTPWARASAF